MDLDSKFKEIQQPDAIFHETCLSNIEQLRMSSTYQPQRIVQALCEGYKGNIAKIGLLSDWLGILEENGPDDELSKKEVDSYIHRVLSSEIKQKLNADIDHLFENSEYPPSWLLHNLQSSSVQSLLLEYSRKKPDDKSIIRNPERYGTLLTDSKTESGLVASMNTTATTTTTTGGLSNQPPSSSLWSSSSISSYANDQLSKDKSYSSSSSSNVNDKSRSFLDFCLLFLLQEDSISIDSFQGIPFDQCSPFVLRAVVKKLFSTMGKCTSPEDVMEEMEAFTDLTADCSFQTYAFIMATLKSIHSLCIQNQSKAESSSMEVVESTEVYCYDHVRICVEKLREMVLERAIEIHGNSCFVLSYYECDGKCNDSVDYIVNLMSSDYRLCGAFVRHLYERRPNVNCELYQRLLEKLIAVVGGPVEAKVKLPHDDIANLIQILIDNNYDELMLDMSKPTVPHTVFTDLIRRLTASDCYKPKMELSLDVFSNASNARRQGVSSKLTRLMCLLMVNWVKRGLNTTTVTRSIQPFIVHSFCTCLKLVVAEEGLYQMVISILFNIMTSGLREKISLNMNEIIVQLISYGRSVALLSAYEEHLGKLSDPEIFSVTYQVFTTLPTPYTAQLMHALLSLLKRVKSHVRTISDNTKKGYTLEFLEYCVANRDDPSVLNPEDIPILDDILQELKKVVYVDAVSY